VSAGRVVLGAGAIETARLLLNSASEREPNGLGNNHDQVGRNLQGHVYVGAIALFDEIVQDCIGPGPSISTNDYRHHNEGIIGGGMLANDFVPTPLQARYLLASLGAIPTWGIESKRGMRDYYSRMAMIFGPIQEVPNPESRVRIDPTVRDRFGIPVARLSGSLRPEDLRAAKFLSERAVEWARASGAKRVIPIEAAARQGPSGGQHQAGTCRMGSDPASSVTDEWGTVWGHDNLHIVDGSLHVTNGGVNPVLTIMALAYRVSRHIARVL
jgi:choline dehydrogenase-like flavoprotein